MTHETRALTIVDQREQAQAMAALRSDAPLTKDDKVRLMDMARYLVANALAPKNDTPETLVAKFNAGRELGLAPMQSMVDLYVVNGYVLGDTRILASQLRAGGWDYYYRETSAERATVVLVAPNGREHALTVTYDECHEAGWDQAYGKTKPSWQGGGRSIMVRYRALSQAIRAFAADTLNLRVDKAKVQRLGGENAPDDPATVRDLVQRLGVTATMGLVLQAQAALDAGAPTDAAALAPGEDDPLDAEFVDQGDDEDDQLRAAEQVRDAIRAQAIAHEGDERPADQRQQGVVAGTLEQLFPNTPDRAARQAARYSLMHYLVGKTTTKELTTGECQALLEWAQVRTPEGEWLIADRAIAEAAMILQTVGAANGQQRML